jgi:hypothetical protein
MLTTRQILMNIYADRRNNYLTIASFADCNGLTEDEAIELIVLSRKVFNSPHPES